MAARQLNEEWTAEIVGRMHRYRISRGELAGKCHFSLTYLSLVLNGNKEFKSDVAKNRTRKKIEEKLGEIENDILREIEKDKEEDWREYFNKTRNL